MTEEVPPRPAATVIVLRPAAAGPDVLLTLRPSSMAFAADMYVFPGGAVDPSDTDPRLAARSSLPPGGAAAALGGGAGLERYMAGIRELFEEAGVLLADPRPDPADAAIARAGLLDGRSTLADIAEDLDLRLRSDLLVPISHWTTPPIMARRFDTRFFAAELPPGAEVTFAPDEVVAHRWATPRAALDAMAAREIAMWVPTGATLQQLEHVRDLDDVRRRFTHRPVAAPRVVVERPDLRRIVVSGAGGVPGRTVNTYLVGRRDVVVVDPGDPSVEAARAVLDAVSAVGGRIVAIALTSADPDHAGGAEGLALRLRVPIVGGPGVGRDLPYEVRELADGEPVPVGDTELVAIATPGPRPDHVAYVDRQAGIVLAGDLVRGRDSQSVLGSPDDEESLRSLDRLGAIDPRLVLPGHGRPLGPEALVPARHDPGWGAGS